MPEIDQKGQWDRSVTKDIYKLLHNLPSQVQLLWHDMPFEVDNEVFLIGLRIRPTDEINRECSDLIGDILKKPTI